MPPKESEDFPRYMARSKFRLLLNLLFSIGYEDPINPVDVQNGKRAEAYESLHPVQEQPAYQPPMIKDFRKAYLKVRLL